MLIEIIEEGLPLINKMPQASWWLDSAAAEPPMERAPIGLSEIDSCVRKLWYQQHHTAKTNLPDPHMVGVWQVGHFMERLAVAALEAGGLTVHDTHTELHWRGIPGHNDGRVVTNEHPILKATAGADKNLLLELKSVKPQKMKLLHRKAVREAYPGYYMQIQAYLLAWKETFGTALDGAIFLAGSKAIDFKAGVASQPWYEEFIMPDPEWAEQRMDYIQDIIYLDDIAERPYTKPAPLCYHCPFQDRCWFKDN